MLFVRIITLVTSLFFLSSAQGQQAEEEPERSSVLFTLFALDSDGDGVGDYAGDAFPEDASEQLDSDGDGIGNNADVDDDGDGVVDGNDDFPLDPSRYEALAWSVTEVPISLDGLTPARIDEGVLFGVSGTVYLAKDDVEHMILPWTLFFEYPLLPVLHLSKLPGGTWQVVGSYPEAAMGVGRDFEYLNAEQDIVFADHGLELRDTEDWPLGHIWIARVLGAELEWTQVSEVRGFYHSVSTGDFTGDGLPDIATVPLGGECEEEGNPYFGVWALAHLYIQQPDGSFTPDTCAILPPERDSSGNVIWRGAYSLQVVDIDGDGVEEIVTVDGAEINGGPRYSYLVYRRNQVGGFDVAADAEPGGLFLNPELAASSLKITDLSGDGIKDMVIAFEGPGPDSAIDVWHGTGGFNFEHVQSFVTSEDEVFTREFELLDVDDDGDKDIVFNPTAVFDNEEGWLRIDDLSQFVYINDGGLFARPADSMVVPYDGIVTWLKAFKLPGQPLKFLGVYTDTPMDNSISIIEIEWDLRP